jgi:hypothetical protein
MAVAHGAYGKRHSTSKNRDLCQYGNQLLADFAQPI